MSKYNDVKEFFDIHLKHLKFDSKLYQRLRDFRLAWTTKDDDYIEFMGSNLTGVHIIRFSSLDDEKLMTDILGIDDIDDLQNEFYKVKGIVKAHKVASNVIYHTLVYVAYRFSISKEKTQVKLGGIYESCFIMSIKMFSSLYNHYFKYNVTEDIALTVSKKLSNKFILKQVGNWYNLFKLRAEECVYNRTPNYKRLMKYNTESAIRIITDIQTKIRSNLLMIYKVLVDVVKKGEYLKQESSTFVGGEKEEKQVKDIENNVSRYRNTITLIAYRPNEFIDPQLVYVIDKLFTTIDGNIIIKSLRCMCNEELHKKHSKLYKTLEYGNEAKDPYVAMLSEILSINIEYLNRWGVNPNDPTTITKVITMIKNYWSSSKVDNPRMKAIKKVLFELMLVCTGKKTAWVRTTLVIAFVTYITIRSMKRE